MRKEIPAPGLPERGDAAAGAAGVWCPGMRGRIWLGAIFFHLPTIIAIHNVLYQLAAWFSPAAGMSRAR